MSQAAQVTSIEAIKDFQAFLCQCCADIREALCAVDMEAHRVLDWVAHDQASFWRRAVRDRQEELAQAKADLFRRQLERLSGEEPDLIEQQEAVWRANRRLHEAEDKVDNCRRWLPLLQHALEEYQAPARQLAALVEGDPPRAVAVLEQVLDALESYVFLAPPTASAPALGTQEVLPNEVDKPQTSAPTHEDPSPAADAQVDLEGRASCP
jgi:hypothetical protein